jgi:hypothetical protein
MAVVLKGDIINRMYSIMRVSGLTSGPTSDDSELALETLEFLAHELEDVWNVSLNYNFEETPDPNAAANIEYKNKYSIAAILAGRLLDDFGKDLTPGLQRKVGAAWSMLMAQSGAENLRQTQYPDRQPVGKGNERWGNRYRRYYRQVAQAPISSATNKMVIDDVNVFVESFASYLGDLEDISSYTIEWTDGLDVTNDSLTSPEISYTVEATGRSTDTDTSVEQVKIVATTSDSRVETRLINFDLTKVEID